MTAVLSPTDALRRDPIMTLEDNQFKYLHPSCHAQSGFLTVFSKQLLLYGLEDEVQ